MIYLIPLPLSTNDKALVLPMVTEIIGHISYFFVENARTSRRFISSLNLGIDIEKLTFFELNKDTSHAQMLESWKKIPQDAPIGIMSEAGCVGIADPGALVVAFAHTQNRRVVPLIGASSIFLALSASGLNGQKFAFHGYLPIDKKQRQEQIKLLEKESLQKQQTQIFIETPFRNNAILEDVLKTLNEQSLLCIASEITSDTEFIQTKRVGQWKKNIPDLHKKPSVFLFLAK